MLEKITQAPLFQAIASPAGALRSRLGTLDAGRAGVNLTAVALVGGAVTLMLSDPAATRNTDTRAEMVARIAPVGEVSIAPRGTATATAATDAVSAETGRDS